MLRSLTGLRPRLLAALFITSAVTLGVAALALLSPLEQRLREDGMRTVRAAIGSVRQDFREIDVLKDGQLDPKDLRDVATLLSRRSNGAQVTILDSGLEHVYAPPVANLDVPDYYKAARRTLKTGDQARITTGESLVVIQRLHMGKPHHLRRYVLIVVKRLQYISVAFKVVRNAFIVAAAAGLGIALLLGIGLTTTLLRRLERLRDATREVERRGLHAPLPSDRGHDEIGELSRSFANLQTRLRREEGARRSFVATASHELRTPLTSLDGMLELLEDDLSGQRPDLQDAKLRTQEAREQTRRLSQLATDLLDLSRLDTEVQLRTEPLELSELSRAVAAEFEIAAGKRSVTVAVTPPPQPCWASADPGSVARIVRILVDNALRFAPQGSTIEVRPSQTDGVAQVCVADDGPGVPSQDRERIFERFTRGSHTAGSTGFGLGLAIGRELAIRMEGSLELQGEARNGQGDGETPNRDDALTRRGERTGTPDRDGRRSQAGAAFVLTLPADAGPQAVE